MSRKCFSQHPSPQDKGRSPTAIWVPPTLFQGGGSIRLQALSWMSQPPKTPLPSIADVPSSLPHTNPFPSECLGDSSLYHCWQRRSCKHLSDSAHGSAAASIYWPGNRYQGERQRICLLKPETWVWPLGREGPRENEMAPHSSILAWESPWTEGPGGLQSRGLKRVSSTTTNRYIMSAPCPSFNAHKSHKW